MIPNFASPEYRHDPYPVYKMLRTRYPLWQSPHGYWVLSKYEDITTVLKNKSLGCDTSILPARPESDWKQRVELFQHVSKTVFGQDGDTHTRLQKPLLSIFNKKRLDQERSKIQSLAHSIIDANVNAGGMDLIKDFAQPLVLKTIFGIIGINQGIINSIAYNTDEVLGKNSIIKVLTPSPYITRDDVIQAIRTHGKLIEYAKQSIEQNRHTPSDNLISSLIQAVDQNEITEEEMVCSVFAIQNTSLDSEVSLLGNAVIALDRFPDQKAMLLNDLTLIPEAVKEALRYDTATQYSIRFVYDKLTIRGTVLPHGSVIVGLVGSANRDPEAFPDPDRFDILRENKNHLSFTMGAHKCLGAVLATLISEEALRALYSRLPALRIKPETMLEYTEPWTIRGVRSLPIIW